MSSPAISQITPRTNSSITPSESTSSTMMSAMGGENDIQNSILMKKEDNSKITKIITSKEWVLPPRPKPGRKPSVDTPATKRKAQNRAAQRAFRERRANRVSELETQILELEREKSIKEGILTNKIKSISKENEYLKKSLDDLKSTVDMLKNQFNLNIKNGRSPSNTNGSISAMSPLATTPSSNSNRKQSTGSQSSASTPMAFSGNQTAGTSSSSSVHDVDLTKAASMMINFKNSPRHGSLSQATSPMVLSTSNNNNNNVSSPGMQRNFSLSAFYQQQVSPHTIVNSPVNIQQERHSSQDDCGICSKDDCICESIGIREKKSSVDQYLNFSSFEPSAAVPLKRKRDNSDDSFSLEIDFTQHFKKSEDVAPLKKMPTLSKLKNSSGSLLSQSKFMDNSRHYENESLFKSPSVSLEYDNSPSASTSNNKAQEEDRISPEDQCGFCSDDTPCVCREIAKQKELTKLKDSALTNQLNQITEEQQPESQSQTQKEQQEPTASQIVQANEQKSSKGNSCTGNPGTCRQCQEDPMSTLFCTTIASKTKAEEEEKAFSKSSSPQPQSQLQSHQHPEHTHSHPHNGSVSHSHSSSGSFSNTNSGVTTPVPQVLPLPRPSLPSFGSNTFGSTTSFIPTPPGNLPVPSATSAFMSPSASHSISATALTPSATGNPVVNLSRSNSVSSLPSLNDLEINNPGKHFIPCSDAYKTLSRHANFRNVGFNSIINKLNTNGMYVEVESVVKCLRELDRKFGSN